MAFRASDKLQLIGSNFMSQALRIATTLVMARFISPKDNGAYFLILYVGGLVMSLGDFCIPQSLVQIRDWSEQILLDTAIVLEASLYGFYGLFTIGAGIWLTHSHGDPRLWKVAVLLACARMFDGLYDVQLACLNRKLQFKAESRQNLVLSLSTAITGITFALCGWGIYAIVLQVLVGQLAGNVAIQFRAPLKWPRQASWAAAKRFIRLGAPLSAASYVSSIEGSIVGLIINSIGGVQAVGLWGKTIQVQQLFAQNLMTAFERVAYPMLCRATQNAGHIRKLFARVTVTLMLVSLLLASVVAVNSRELIRICLGPMWMDAIPLLHITALAIPAGALAIVGYMLCMALGQSRSILKTSILNLCFFIPMIMIGKHWGLVGLAVCWSLSRYLIALGVLTAGARRIATGLHAVWKELGALLTAAAVAAIVMAFVIYLLPGFKTLPRFILSGGLGTFVYLAAVWLLERDSIIYAWSMARGRSVDSSAAPTVELSPAPQIIEPATTAAADSPAFLLSASGTQPDGPSAASLTPAPDFPAPPKDETHPLNVWLVCTGVGIMNRGIESFFRECFDGLHPHAAAAGIHLQLIKGRGPGAPDEHPVWCLPRTGKLAIFLGKLINRNGYVIEQISSVWPIEQLIRRDRPDVLLYSDMNLVLRLERHREKLGVPFKLIYSNGAPMHPPFGQCDHVQQVAPPYMEEAMAAGESPDHHSLVPYGFTIPTGAADFDPAQRRRTREDLHLPVDRKIVLSVGWIAAKHKRMDYLIRELASLPEPRPYLVLLGAMDDQTPPILDLARQMLGEANFTARTVPYQDVSRYYQAADTFALASLVEGFGRVYVEACMHGLPCAVHDHPVMRFVLGEEGTFGDFSKPGTLAEILRQMTLSPLDIVDMTRRRRIMRERFGWESLAPAYFQMFRKVAQS